MEIIFKMMLNSDSFICKVTNKKIYLEILLGNNHEKGFFPGIFFKIDDDIEIISSLA